MANQPVVTLTKRQLEDEWRDLLGATLEAWAHMILYVRKVYDEESFSSTTVLFGLRLYQNRHPQVASYIAEAIEVALPSIMSRVADTITLVITEIPSPEPATHRPIMELLSHAQQDSMSDDDEEMNYQDMAHDNDDNMIQPQAVVLEKYELRFPFADSLSKTSQPNNCTNYTASAIEYLEREMREILLSVYAMKDTDEGVSQSSESVSFRLNLHIPQANATCPELNQAFAAGTWRVPPNPSTKSLHKTPYVIRPLHSMDALTSPIGPVQFSVKYPRAVQSPQKKHTMKTLEHLSHDTQSTPTLDF